MTTKTRHSIEPTIHFPLEGFLEVLKRAEFEVLPTHYLEVQMLLDSLVPEQAFEDLKSLLCPLFALNAEEQERFYEVFETYFSSLEQTVSKKKEVFIQKELEKTVTPIESASPKHQSIWIDLTFLAVSMAIWAGAWGVLYYYFKEDFYLFISSIQGWQLNLLVGGIYLLGGLTFYGVLSLVRSLARKLNLADFTYSRAFFSSAVIFILGFVILVFMFSTAGIDIMNLTSNLVVVLLGFCSFLLLFFYDRFFKKPAKQPLETLKSPPLHHTPKIPLPNLDLLSKTETHHLNHSLNQASTDFFNTSEIDITKTLHKTIRNAGRVEIEFKKANRKPQYLLLIDQSHSNQHQVEWFDYLQLVLQQDKAAVERYYFQYDPRYCWQDSPASAIPLQNIYAGQRLLILSHGDLFVDLLSGHLFAWATDLFSLWKEKAILTAKPIEDWTYLEKVMSEEFYIAPSTVEGMLETINYFDAISDKTLEDWHLADRFDVFNSDDIELIYNNLPKPVFEWIAACAVYPETFWQLTLFLGQLLEIHPNELLNKNNLTILSRLKWFQQGKIPHEIRRKLIQQLSEEKLVQVRRAIVKILRQKQNIPPSNSYAYEDYQLNLWRNQYTLTKDKTEKANLLNQLDQLLKEVDSEDAELLHFMENKKQYLVTEKRSMGKTSLLRSIFPKKESSEPSYLLHWVDYSQGAKGVLRRDDLTKKVAAANNILLCLPNEYGGKNLLIDDLKPIEEKTDLILVFDCGDMSLKKDLIELAEILHLELARIGLEDIGDKNLVVLSMTVFGLVARYLVEQLAQPISQLVQLGTPNQGLDIAPFARWTTKIYKWLSLILPFEAIQKINRVFEQTLSGSTFLETLNSSPDPLTPYAIIIGDYKLYSQMTKPSFSMRINGQFLQHLLYEGRPSDGYTSVDSALSLPPDRQIVPEIYEVPAMVGKYFEVEESQATIFHVLEVALRLVNVELETDTNELEQLIARKRALSMELKLVLEGAKIKGNTKSADELEKELIAIKDLINRQQESVKQVFIEAQLAIIGRWQSIKDARATSRIVQAIHALNSLEISPDDLSNSYLKDADLEGAYLKATKLVGANLEKANLIKADLSFTSIQKAHFKETFLTATNFTEAHLKQSNFVTTSFWNLNLTQADFSECSFIDCQFLEITSAYMVFNGADFINTHFEGLDWSNAEMKRTHFDKCTLERVKFVKTDQEQARFQSAQIQEVEWSEVNLEHGYFQNCTMTSVIFRDTNLIAIQFENTQIQDGLFIKTDLKEVKFLSGTFEKVQFEDCFFEKTVFEKIEFIACQFSGKELELVRFINCQFDESTRASDGFNRLNIMPKPKVENTKSQPIDFQHIKELIRQDKLEEALTEASKVQDENFRKDVILLQSQFHKYQYDLMAGLISTNEAHIQKNKINYALLRLIDYPMEEKKSESELFGWFRSKSKTKKTAKILNRISSQKIRQFISRDQLEKALVILNAEAQKIGNRELTDAGMILERQFQELSHQEMLGLLSLEEKYRLKSRITESLLNLIDDFSA